MPQEPGLAEPNRHQALARAWCRFTGLLCYCVTVVTVLLWFTVLLCYCVFTGTGLLVYCELLV
jgi:hypothetical protein